MRSPNIFFVPLASLLAKKQAEATLKQLRKAKACKARAKLEAKGVIR
jgi:hypothetical protein